MKIGFVGLGRMGVLMAGRLVAAGHQLIVYDSNPAADVAGATRATSPMELAQACDTVFLSLPNGKIVRDVLLAEGGICRGESRIRQVIDLSTIGPGAAIGIAAELAALEIAWVEAPVSGGPGGAEKGTLAIMLSGDAAVIERVRPLIGELGKVFIAGAKPGMAQTVKLGNNMLSTAAIVLTSEVMAMGAKAGIDPDVMLEIINAGSGRNSATVDKFPRAVVSGRFDYGFATALAYKDIRLCVDESEALGVPMIAGAVVRQMMAATQASFGPNSDFTEVAKIYEGWGGAKIRRADAQDV